MRMLFALHMNSSLSWIAIYHTIICNWLRLIGDEFIIHYADKWKLDKMTYFQAMETDNELVHWVKPYIVVQAAYQVAR